MLLDKPGRFLYKHNFDLYPAMRAFCCDYRYLCCGVVVALAVFLAWLLITPSAMTFLGVTK